MAEDTVSIHAGHRERLRRRFRETGLNGFSEHEVLELLLTFVIARRDVNPLAHALLDTFGSLSAVLDADMSELMRVKGVGRQTALLLRLMPQLLGRYQMSALGERPVILTLADARRYCEPLFTGVTQERVYMICLDQAGHVLHRSLLHTGTVDQVSLHPRTVVETALRCKAASVLLAHNHPGGMAAPSKADEQITSKAAAALYMIGIRLVDHLIFAGASTYSMIRETPIAGDREALSYVRNLNESRAGGLCEGKYDWMAFAPDE